MKIKIEKKGNRRQTYETILDNRNIFIFDYITKNKPVYKF